MASGSDLNARRLNDPATSSTSSDASQPLYGPPPPDDAEGTSAEVKGVGIVGPWPGSHLGLDSESPVTPLSQADTAEGVMRARVSLRQWLQQQAGVRPIKGLERPPPEG